MVGPKNSLEIVMAFMRKPRRVVKRSRCRSDNLFKGECGTMKKVLVLAVLVFALVVGTAFDSLAQKQPETGGTLKIISPMGPTVLGYYPEMGPSDHSAAFPALESIMEMNEQRKMVPFLAEAVDIDEKKLTYTIRLRKGIKFHDGSDLNAQVCAWNYQLLKDTNKIQYGEQIKKIEVVNDQTVVLHLAAYNNQMNWAYGWIPMLSKLAFETKGKDWLQGQHCRHGSVQAGGVEEGCLPEMGEVRWLLAEGETLPRRHRVPIRSGRGHRVSNDAGQGGRHLDQCALHASGRSREEGMVRKSYWSALETVLYVNTKDANKPTANVKVREAIEYAIDRPGSPKPWASVILPSEDDPSQG